MVFEDTNLKLTLISEDIKSYYTVRQLELPFCVFSSVNSVLCLPHMLLLGANPRHWKLSLPACAARHSHCSQSISRTVTSHFVLRYVAVSILLASSHVPAWPLLKTLSLNMAVR